MELALGFMIILFVCMVAWFRNEIERERSNGDFWRDTALMYRKVVFPSKID